VVTRSTDGRDLRMFLDGDLQFSSVDEYRYHEALVHPAMAGTGVGADAGAGAATARRVLVLGGGDGLAAREVLRHDTVDEVVQVDLDPAVTRMARRMPELARLNGGSLDDPRLTLVHDDAFTWTAARARARAGAGAEAAGGGEDEAGAASRAGADDEPFDVVILDLPDPDRLELVRLYSEEMYRAVAALLAPDGRIVVQAGSPYFARHAFWSIEATVRAAGLDTVPYHVDVPSFGDWGFVLASPSTARLPAGTDLGVTTRFLTPEVLDAAQAFGADVARLPVEVNTVDNPVLLDYTNRGWSDY
jgi:spermidine synthase